MNASIIFGDGSELTAEKNGDCYILQTKPEFPDPLGDVTITSEEGEKIVENAQLIECASVDGKYWFSFIEVDERDRTIEILEEAIAELAEIIGGGE